MYELLSSRDLLGELKHLPRVGFVAMKNKSAIAAGFLRMVEGKFALLDGLITYHTEDSYLRHRAIHGVVTYLIQEARKLGLESIIAYSKDDGTLIRSESHGFKKLDHAIIALDLKEMS